MKTANEWLIANYPGGPMDGMEYRTAMERYANYKTKELQAQILTFRMKLKDIDCSPGGSIGIGIDNQLFMEPLEKYYDKHFNITSERHGTIK